jgi:hypothetical protein
MDADSRKTTLCYSLCGTVALAAAGFALYATSIWGPGITSDSYLYLMGAKNLLSGNGLSWLRIGELVPLIAWPPLFPSTVALVGSAGMDVRDAARLLNAVLFAVNVVLACRLLKRAGISPLATLLGAIVLASAPSMLRVHSYVESEPLFFLLLLSGLTFLAQYIEKPSLAKACCFGIAAGMAALTRYAGISLALCGLITVLLLSEGHLRRRVIDAGIVALLGCAPLSAWFVRNSIVAHDLPGRTIIWRCPAFSSIPSLLGDVSQWLLPKAVPAAIRGVVLLAVMAFVVFLVISFIRDKGRRTMPIALAVLIFALCYEVVVMATVLLMDPLILGYERIQLPLFLALLVFCLVTVGRYIAGRLPKATIATLIIALALLNTGRAVAWASNAHLNGQPFACQQWASSPIVSHIKELLPKARLFSNAPPILYAVTGRESSTLPVNGTFIYLPNERLEEDRQLLRQNCPPGSYVVIFTQYGYDPRQQADIEAILRPVDMLYSGPDGTILTPASAR